jgi:hypothetical protein
MVKYKVALLVKDVHNLSFLNKYLITKLSSNKNICICLIAQNNSNNVSIISKLNKKLKFWGIVYFSEYIISYPFRFFYIAYQSKKIDNYFNSKILYSDDLIIKFSGTKDEVLQYLNSNNFNLIIQAGYGILNRSFVSSCKSLILNLHHGIASNIRGVDSLLWAFYYNRIDMLGGTIHEIDEGIDTGRILKFVYPVKFNINSSFYDVFIEITEIAFNEIVYLSKNDFSNVVFYPNIKGIYKSSISGFKILKFLIVNR